MSLRRLWSQHANANKALWPTRVLNSTVGTLQGFQRAEMEICSRPIAPSGFRPHLVHQGLRQPSPALSAWGRRSAALDFPEPHAEAVALARGPVRHPAQPRLVKLITEVTETADRIESPWPRCFQSRTSSPSSRHASPGSLPDMPGECARTQKPGPATPNFQNLRATLTGPLVDPKNSKLNGMRKLT